MVNGNFLNFNSSNKEANESPLGLKDLGPVLKYKKLFEGETWKLEFPPNNLEAFKGAESSKIAVACFLN